MILDDLFPFPIVMVDGHNEDRKAERNQRLGLATDDEEPEVDIIEGMAECPYYDFLSITDRWLPTDTSLEKAFTGKFEACFVQFREAGSFVVPWNKEHFKKKLRDFIQTREQPAPKAKKARTETAKSE
jgi:hypothetical protein